jgi:mRNA interferase HigB
MTGAPYRPKWATRKLKLGHPSSWTAMQIRPMRTPEDVKVSYPKASILKGSRVVLNIKGNDYRLIASVQYQAGVLAIRFFGTHAEYDKIDAESV